MKDRVSRSARDAASSRHVAHYFGVITLLLWAHVKRMQRRSETRPCAPAEEAPPLQATHYALARVRGGAAVAAGEQMFRHQMTAPAPAPCQQGSRIKHSRAASNRDCRYGNTCD